MAEDIVFDPALANVSNLRTLSSDMLVLEERRICELYELALQFVDCASELMDCGMTMCELLSVLSGGEILPNAVALHAGAMGSNLLRLSSYSDLISSLDKAVFCSLLKECFLKRGIAMSEADFLPSGMPEESFVYVKNVFADEAYDVFSQEFSDPRVAYVSSFREALSRVADGTVSYCLLPIEERGVRLSTVAELLFKGDFKIVSVTPVLGFDGMADMKYALVSRFFSLSPTEPDDDRYLELRVPKDSGVSLADILSAAEHYRLSVYKLNTVRFDTEEGEREYFSLIFRASGADFTEILTYLTLFADEFIPVGVYKNIE